MGGLWEWWQGVAPWVGEELLTWSWHVAGLVVLVWLATSFLRRKPAGIRAGLWLTSLLLVPFLPLLVRVSLLPSTSVATLVGSVRPSPVPPPSLAPVLPTVVPEASVTPATATIAPVAGPAELRAPAPEPVSSPPRPVTVAAGSEAEPTTPSFRQQGRFWIAVGVLGWVLGAVLMSVRVLASLRWIHRLRRSARPVADGQLAGAFAKARQQIGVSERVVLLSSEMVSVPVTLGVFRPAVIIPRDLATPATQGPLDHAFYHELAHVRRRDAAVTLYRRLLGAVLFFHPLLWLVGRRYEAEQEHVCDDWALSALGDRCGYARSLTALAGQARHAAPVAALGFAHRPSVIRLRVTRILEDKEMPRPRLGRLGLLTVASVSLLALALTTSFPLLPSVTEARAAEPSTSSPTAVPALAPSPSPTSPPAPAAAGTPAGIPVWVSANP